VTNAFDTDTSGEVQRMSKCRCSSALTSLKARIGLVDNVNATLAANEPIVAMAQTQGPQGIFDFHDMSPLTSDFSQSHDANPTGHELLLEPLSGVRAERLSFPEPIST